MMFKTSENMREEYCAQIVKIGKVEPVENSDRLVKTIINGFQVVVGKDDVKEGDIMVYCKLETAINSEFLSVNNQFEISERHLNKNHKDVEALLADGKEDEAKSMVGYFNKHGRVRIVKLRGCPSEGCLFTIDSLIKWNKKIADYNFEQCLVPNEDGVIEPFNFDTIDDELFVKAYVPAPNIVSQGRGDKMSKKTRKLTKRFDRMVEGQFRLHYETNQLQDNMWRFKPDTVVAISVKEHGTSHIVGKVLTKKPKDGSVARKRMNKRLEKELMNLNRKEHRFYWQKRSIKARAAKIKEILNSQFTLGYGKVTSSRSVIKNQYINQVGPASNFYKPLPGKKDIWNEYGDLLYPFLLDGMTVYSEIVGYNTGTTGMIQKGYDYGCNPGENQIMPYRITFTDADGVVTEWDVMEVSGWAIALIKDHPELKSRVKPITVLYHGTLGDLYPDINTEEHWNENVLERMKNDVEHFGMEQNEPMCKTKVPREGIVMRIDGDIKSEAFKLKTNAFKMREAKQMDAGEVDVEMQDSYGNK